MNGIEALFFMSFIVVPALCLWNIYLTVRVKTLDAAICRVWNRYVRDQAINQAIDQDPAAVRSAHWRGIGDPYEDFPNQDAWQGKIRPESLTPANVPATVKRREEARKAALREDNNID